MFTLTYVGMLYINVAFKTLKVYMLHQKLKYLKILLSQWQISVQKRQFKIFRYNITE